MSTAPIIVTEDKNHIIVRFNRPEIRSPLSVSVLEEVSNIVSGVASRSTIERLIFTGTRDAFASGADLREIATVGSPDAAMEYAIRGQSLMTRISELPVLTIAAVNGICFGGALDLALACDRRIAAEEAVFSHPGANLGIITGWGGTQRLPRLVGEAIALEMLFTAKRVTAREALACGLVDEIAGDVVARALES